MQILHSKSSHLDPANLSMLKNAIYPSLGLKAPWDDFNLNLKWCSPDTNQGSGHKTYWFLLKSDSFFS